jgi:hypothetical protein
MKTEAMWSARATGGPKFDIVCWEHKVPQVNSFKYLGYHICTKLRWTKTKMRQRTAIIKNSRTAGTSNPKLRKTLYSVYVLPLFTWLFIVFPVLTSCQVVNLNHFYFSCLNPLATGPVYIRAKLSIILTSL